jgi:antitoxin HicB
MMLYPVTLTPDDNDTILVTFPDFPEAVTFGADREEALARAIDALETIIDAYIKDRQPIPTPSTASADAMVTLPPLVAAKVQLHNEMRRQKMGKTALAERMNVHLPQVDRLLDVHHGSTVEQLDAAAKALGGQVRIELVMPEPVSGAMMSRVAGMYAGRKVGTPRAPKRHRPVPRMHAGLLTTAKKRRDGRRVMAGKKK